MSAVFTRAPWPEIRRVRAALGLSLREANRALMRHGSADAAIAALLAEPDRESFEAAERVRMAAPDLLAALEDMLAGWKYIRSFHGDLYGVGWDRAQDKAVAALAKARSTS